MSSKSVTVVRACCLTQCVAVWCHYWELRIVGLWKGYISLLRCIKRAFIRGGFRVSTEREFRQRCNIFRHKMNVAIWWRSGPMFGWFCWPWCFFLFVLFLPPVLARWLSHKPFLTHSRLICHYSFSNGAINNITDNWIESFPRLGHFGVLMVNRAHSRPFLQVSVSSCFCSICSNR